MIVLNRSCSCCGGNVCHVIVLELVAEHAVALPPRRRQMRTREPRAGARAAAMIRTMWMAIRAVRIMVIHTAAINGIIPSDRVFHLLSEVRGGIGPLNSSMSAGRLRPFGIDGPATHEVIFDLMR